MRVCYLLQLERSELSVPQGPQHSFDLLADPVALEVATALGR